MDASLSELFSLAFLTSSRPFVRLPNQIIFIHFMADLNVKNKFIQSLVSNFHENMSFDLNFDKFLTF